MDRKSKIYIAGKITGDSNYRRKFDKAREVLEAQGFIVLSPATMPEGMKPADYMRICLAMIESADAVVFLPDYKDSKGAQLEKAWCEYVGKKTYFVED